MATKVILTCPHCGRPVQYYKNPFPTVDIIISFSEKEGTKKRGVVLVFRKNEPKLWALPGGFIDYGESAEEAAIREAKEETGLSIKNIRQFRVYSDPDRDPRQHNITIVFYAEAEGNLEAGSDAKRIKLFSWEELPDIMAFDHRKILNDFMESSCYLS